MRYVYIFILLISAGGVSAQKSRTLPQRSNGLDFRHLASFTPFSGIIGYGGINPGVGVDYEYILSPESGIGLHIPLMVGFSGPEDFSFNNYTRSILYTAPGIRFHTARRGSNVDFVTGLGILIGNMHYKPNYDNYYNPNYNAQPFDYGMLGIVADNSLNFYRNHFVFGFDIRVGALAEVREGTRYFMHFGMHFGGKF